MLVDVRTDEGVIPDLIADVERTRSARHLEFAAEAIGAAHDHRAIQRCYVVSATPWSRRTTTCRWRSAKRSSSSASCKGSAPSDTACSRATCSQPTPWPCSPSWAPECRFAISSAGGRNDDCHRASCCCSRRRHCPVVSRVSAAGALVPSSRSPAEYELSTGTEPASSTSSRAPEDARQRIRRAGLARTRSSCMSRSPMPTLGPRGRLSYADARGIPRDGERGGAGAVFRRVSVGSRQERVEIPNPAHRNRKDTRHPPRHGRTTEARRKRDGDHGPRRTRDARRSHRGARPDPGRPAARGHRRHARRSTRPACGLPTAPAAGLPAGATERRCRGCGLQRPRCARGHAPVAHRTLRVRSRPRARAAARRGDCPYCREHE